MKNQPEQTVIDQKQKEPLQTPPTITAGKGMCSEVRPEGEKAKRAIIENKQTSQAHQEDQTPQSPVLHPPYLC